MAYTAILLRADSLAVRFRPFPTIRSKWGHSPDAPMPPLSFFFIHPFSFIIVPVGGGVITAYG